MSFQNSCGIESKDRSIDWICDILSMSMFELWKSFHTENIKKTSKFIFYY